MKPDDEIILVERPTPEVVRLVLNCPERRNALSVGLMVELNVAIAEIMSEKSVRVVLLRGAGPVFCSGLDLKEASTDETHRSASMVAETFCALAAIPAVTVAVVHGAAVGGGAGLMAACDYVVAEADAKIGFPEVRRGLVAALILAFLRRQLRERHLRELLLGGELVPAERALELGLVNRVVPNGTGEAAALEFVHAVLRGAPGAIARTKALIACAGESIDGDLESALRFHLEARMSDEAKEGIGAFLRKCAPSWERGAMTKAEQ